MRNQSLIVLSLWLAFTFCACSPRNYLTRRLAADLIAGSTTFKAPQLFWLRIGVVSNQNYMLPESLVLQHHGWIAGKTTACPAGLTPAPCWNVVLTPAGVDTFQPLMARSDLSKQYFSVPSAKRELKAITGISKQGSEAVVDFIWRWVPLNEVGAALYSSDRQYKSSSSFRRYDDGWRLLDAGDRPVQRLEDALKNAEPAQ